MYNVSDIKRVLSSPKLAIREMNRLYHTDLRRTDGNPGGTDLFERDWDICIILDACRFDYFRETTSERLPGSLQQIESVASSTIEWLNVSVRGSNLHDTVYVTANPKLFHSSVSKSIFHDVVYTWEEVENSDEKHRSLDPDLMTDLLIEACDKYPNKRIVGHYMQPHCPFLGSMGGDTVPETPWSQHLLKKKIDVDSLEQAYIENLNYISPHLQTVFEQVDDKIVVTADHGQLLGERVSPIPIREYSHPAGMYVPELVEVPYQVREGTNRRRVTSEPPVVHESASASDEHDVDDLLEQLGYRS